MRFYASSVPLSALQLTKPKGCGNTSLCRCRGTRMPDQQSSTPHVRANEREIIIYHVGGSGNYGLATTIIERIKPHVSVVVFEARDDAGDTERAETTVSEGYRTT